MNDIYDKEPKGYLYFSKELFPEDTSNIVMHNVSGDGMFNAGIYDGDCLIFDKSLTPQNRDIVSATIDDRLACRRILINDGVVSFRREDGNTPDCTPSDYSVHSVAVGLIRMKRFNS